MSLQTINFTECLQIFSYRWLQISYEYCNILHFSESRPGSNPSFKNINKYKMTSYILNQTRFKQCVCLCLSLSVSSNIYFCSFIDLSDSYRYSYYWDYDDDDDGDGDRDVNLNISWVDLTFTGPRIIIYSYNTTNKMHRFPQIIYSC